MGGFNNTKPMSFEDMEEEVVAEVKAEEVTEEVTAKEKAEEQE